MLHFRSHETPTLIHPASRTRDMHTPFEDNLRCMGKKFSRNFLGKSRLLSLPLSYFTSAYYSTQITRRDIKTKTSHFYNNRSNDISSSEEHTSYFTFSLSFLFFFFSLLSILPFTRTQRISSSTQTFPSRIVVALVSLSHCNQRIHFPEQSTVYQDQWTPAGGT